MTLITWNAIHEWFPYVADIHMVDPWPHAIWPRNLWLFTHFVYETIIDLFVFYSSIVSRELLYTAHMSLTISRRLTHTSMWYKKCKTYHYACSTEEILFKDSWRNVFTFLIVEFASYHSSRNSEALNLKSSETYSIVMFMI